MRISSNLKMKILQNMLDVKKTHGSNKKILSLVGRKKFTRYQDVVGEIFDWYKTNKIYKY